MTQTQVIRPNRYEDLMAATERPSGTSDAGRRKLEISISVQTILLVAGVVVLALALASIAKVLLMIFVSIFSVAVLLPVVSFMERHFHWSRGLSSTTLVVATFIVIGAVLLVLVQAISGAVRGLSHLPHIVDQARHSDVGNFINGGSDSLDTLRNHASDITKGVGKRRAESPTSEPRLSGRSPSLSRSSS